MCVNIYLFLYFQAHAELKGNYIHIEFSEKGPCREKKIIQYKN